MMETCVIKSEADDADPNKPWPGTKVDVKKEDSSDLKSDKENKYDHGEKSYARFKLNFERNEIIRLEEIPKEELKKYGINLDDDYDNNDGEPYIQHIEQEESEEEEGKLVIDEQNAASLFNIHYIEVPNLKIQGDMMMKPLSCSYKDCKRKFYSALAKSNHEEMHCPHCGVLFNDPDELHDHYKKHCDFRGCMDLIEDDVERNKHKKIHDHPHKPFQCGFCKKRFHFYRHTKKHREFCKISKNLYRCKFCKISFGKVSQFNKHVAKHANAISCTDCNKNYVNWNVYNKHLGKLHGKRLVYQCNKCPKRFQYQDSIKEHIRCHNLSIIDCNLSDFIKIEVIKK